MVTITMRKLRALLRKKYHYYFGAFLFVILTFYTVSWKFSCLDIVLDYKISKECTKYYRNEITGNLCTELCAGNSISSFRCLPQKNAVHNDKKFLGVKGGHTILLNKVKKDETYEVLTWIDKKTGKIHYPTAEEFQNLVKRLVMFNFNISLPHDQLANLVQLKNENNHILFRASMNVAWNLIQDNDFLIAQLFDSLELFPKIYGFCGSTFFTEYLGEPLQVERTSPMKLSAWRFNVKIAILIMDFIEELELSRPQFVMCDIDMDKFGIIDNRMKYGDMTNLFSTFFINRLLSSSKPCNNDADCSYKSCKSICDRDAKICAEKLLNSNLQIVCEKIFKGTKESPGILVSNHAPTILRNMIDRCSNPKQKADMHSKYRLGPSNELRHLIYNELANIYENLG